MWEAQGQDLDEFKYFKRWFEEMSARPAGQAGMTVGNDLSQDPATLSDGEKEARRKLLYNQRARPVREY